MSYDRYLMNLFSLHDLDYLSPDMPDFTSSRDCSPVASDALNQSKAKAAASQSSMLLKLPDDIFKCVMDYLDRDAALRRSAQLLVVPSHGCPLVAFDHGRY